MKLIIEVSWPSRTVGIRPCADTWKVVQDFIVLGLCAALFIAMLIKLFHLGKSLIGGTDFSAVVADILFILVLIELFRLLIIYLEEHRISVATMVEVGIVATLREVILTGAMQVD